MSIRIRALCLATGFSLVTMAACTEPMSSDETDSAVLPVDGAVNPTMDLTMQPRDLGPCGGPCSGATPHCDPQLGRCVACLADKDCPLGNLCHMGACQPGCSPLSA